MNTREVTQQYRLNQWAEIIQKCRSSGQSNAEWCTENNINIKRYYYWLRRVRTAACESLPAIRENSQPIIPVNIPAALEVNTTPPDAISAHITLRLGNAVVELHNGASTTLIENTLKALQYVR